MAAVKAASAVHVAPNDSCARSRSGHRAVADRARPDAPHRLRTQFEQEGNPTLEADHEPLTPHGRPADTQVEAPGDLHVTNSRDGHAIFQATGLAPGRSVSGTVQLANSGSLPGDLALRQLGLQDQPGAGGGRLSDVIHLDISDVTAGSSVPIFTGQLGGPGSRSLGGIGARDSRTFRFTARYPRAATTPTRAPGSRSPTSGPPHQPAPARA
jgi:hypothetical protein